MPEKYGTLDWFENIFKLTDVDPWGHNWRAIEQYRHHLTIRFITKYIPNQGKISNHARLLDIGCATGDFTNRLYHLNKNVTGIDISPTAIKRAKAKFNFIDFRIDSLPKSSFSKNTFDLITCLEVIYYLHKSTQNSFLMEMNKLLKKDGLALITSTIGKTPYFEPKELITLLAEHFQIRAVKYYGATVYSRFEQAFFRKYQQITKVQRLLTFNRQELEKEFPDFNNQTKKIIRKIIFIVIKFRVSKFVTYAFLEALSNTIRIILGWKFSAKASHFISETLSLRPTHTFVLVAKRDE